MRVAAHHVAACVERCGCMDTGRLPCNTVQMEQIPTWRRHCQMCIVNKTEKSAVYCLSNTPNIEVNPKQIIFRAAVNHDTGIGLQTHERGELLQTAMSFCLL